MPIPAKMTLFSAWVLGVVLFSACGSPAKEATFSNLKPIFSRSCNFSSCHGSANMAYGNLKLTGTDAYCQLAGPSLGATFRKDAQASFPRRVDKGQRDKSFLFKKLILTDEEMGVSKPLGRRMPLSANLDQDEIDLFGRWIDEGAKDDDPQAGPCQ